MSESIKLSVLVCGLYERMPGNNQLKHAVNALNRQAKDQPVEILTLYDNRAMSVGRKRSILLSIAQGEYLSFVDDDDSVADDYISAILAKIKQLPGTDVFTFWQDCVRGDLGGRVEKCRYGLGLEYRSGQLPDGSLWWEGKPAHTMVWRTELIQGIEWVDQSFGEDVDFVAKACRLAKTDYRIDKVLYTYRFDPERSRTRGR